MSGPRPVTLLLFVPSVSQRERMGVGWLACKFPTCMWFALILACLTPFPYFSYPGTLNIVVRCSSEMSDGIHCIKHCYILRQNFSLSVQFATFHMFSCDNIHISKRYRLHPVVCIISYGYDHQHNNETEYLWVKTKTDITAKPPMLIQNKNRKKTLNYEHITHTRIR
jgi:hypothetical protein